MSILNICNWRGPVPNRTPGAMKRPRGLVLHIEQGSETGSGQWFHDPNAQASAHFGNPKTGRLDQWVDTDDKAWAECAGNPLWWSVEHEGFSGQSLTDSQLDNDAHLFAVLHQQYGIPFQTTNDPNGLGLGYHAMGGALWGGHTQCPGDPIKAQRAEILRRSMNLVHAPSTHAAPAPSVPHFPGVLGIGSTGDGVKQMQQRLKDRGWKISVDGSYGPGTAQIVAAFQADKHMKADGVCGSITWNALFVAPVTGR